MNYKLSFSLLLIAFCWASGAQAQQPNQSTNQVQIANPATGTATGSTSMANEVVPTVTSEAIQLDSLPENQVVKAKSLLQVIRDGGPLMIPIGICSFILMVFVFERSISLRKGRITPGPFVKRFLDQLKEGQLDRESALELCQKNKSPVSVLFAAGVKKWGRPSVEVEQAILDTGERVSNELRSYLRLLNGIATVCPLLGLLGTVFGMIHAFDAISSVDPSQGDPKALIATGISQALLTTAAGMSVAIPALISYLYFSSRVDRRVMEIDALGLEVVNSVSAEGLAERSGRRKNTTSQANHTGPKSTSRSVSASKKTSKVA